MQHQTYVHRARHKFQHARHTSATELQRTPCHPMRHAQLSGARIANHLRACDAAALEADRPTVYIRHATNLQTPSHFAADPIGLPMPHVPWLRCRRSPQTRTSRCQPCRCSCKAPHHLNHPAHERGAPSLPDDNGIPQARCNVQQVRTACSIKCTCIVRSTRCNMHHTTCNVHRSPCCSMQHAQLAATRIAHRRRARDAAALERD